jgi:cytosine/uracil/thiamine/allantoin permease
LWQRFRTQLLTLDNPAVLSQLWLDTSYSSGARAGAFFTGLGLLICQIAINTIDNAFSAGMDMAAVRIPNTLKGCSLILLT